MVIPPATAVICARPEGGLSMEQPEPVMRFLRVQRKDIAYIRYVFEGYEGIANATTVDEQRGLLRLQIAPDFVESAEAVLQALGKEITLEMDEGIEGTDQ